MVAQQNCLIAKVHWTASGNPHLVVQQNFFHSDNFRDKIKNIGSPARWDQSKCEWDCPLTPASVVVLKQVAEEFNIPIQWESGLAEYAHKQIETDNYEHSVRLAVEKSMRSTDQLPSYPTALHNNRAPMRHQQIAYHWGLRVTGLMLAWDPGTGKTKAGTDMAGGWYRHGYIRPMSNYLPDGKPVWWPVDMKLVENKKTQQKEWRVDRPARWGVIGGILVVCPKSVMRTWTRELKNWQGMTSVEITGSRESKFKKAGMQAHAHIINYESLDIVVQNHYDAIIVDECHRCANHTTQTTRVLEISLRCNRRLTLTGTPVSNNLASLFYQMLITDGGRSLGVSHTAFMQQFFTQQPVDNKGHTAPQAKETAAEQIAAKMASHCYFLKKEEALDLPEKVHAPVYLEMTDDQARYYEQVKKEAITYIQDAEVTVEMAAQRMMKLMQICQGIVRGDDGTWKRFNNIKQETLLEDLQSELRGRKVVVWCRFTEEINSLVEAAHKAGIWSLRFDSEISGSMRNRSIDAWNNDPRYTLFVGQLAMGEGIELVAENCMTPCFETYYLGLDYRYVNWKQTQDRIHRLTQKFKCYYKYLLTPNGVDNAIYQALLAKESTANVVHKTGKDFYLSLLTDDTPNLGALV
jgi:hypothetical protein